MLLLEAQAAVICSGVAMTFDTLRETMTTGADEERVSRVELGWRGAVPVGIVALPFVGQAVGVSVTKRVITVVSRIVRTTGAVNRQAVEEEPVPVGKKPVEFAVIAATAVEAAVPLEKAPDLLPSLFENVAFVEGVGTAEDTAVPLKKAPDLLSSMFENVPFAEGVGAPEDTAVPPKEKLPVELADGIGTPVENAVAMIKGPRYLPVPCESENVAFAGGTMTPVPNVTLLVAVAKAIEAVLPPAVELAETSGSELDPVPRGSSVEFADAVGMISEAVSGTLVPGQRVMLAVGIGISADPPVDLDLE